jgi:hypothetical protein
MMRDVLRIAVKDFQIQLSSAKSYAITVAIFVVAYFLLGSGQSSMMLPLIALLILYRFINLSMYEDEKNNTLRLLASLPVKRDTIVTARYLSTGISIIILGLMLCAASVLVPSNEADGSIALIMCTYFFYVIMMSVYMPIGFKLGYIRAVNINRFIFFGIFLLIGAISLLLKKISGQQAPDAVTRVVTLLTETDPLIIVAAFALITLLLYIISMRISMLLFRKRAIF